MAEALLIGERMMKSGLCLVGENIMCRLGLLEAGWRRWKGVDRRGSELSSCELGVGLDVSCKLSAL